MRSANEALFREIVPTLSHFTAQYNEKRSQGNFVGGDFYEFCPQHPGYRVYDITIDRDCGIFGMEDLVYWAFEMHWKFEGLFVEEWLEQFRVADIPPNDVEELL